MGWESRVEEEVMMIIMLGTVFDGMGEQECASVHVSLSPYEYVRAV
jgi:hypothetical protein